VKFTVDSRPISYSVAAVKLAWGAVVKTADGAAAGRPAAAGTISLWSILKGLGLAVMALSLAAVWPSAGVRAGPDPCSVDATGTIATCSGNQSA
jgi:hypothetical protein